MDFKIEVERPKNDRVFLRIEGTWGLLLGTLQNDEWDAFKSLLIPSTKADFTIMPKQER